MLHALYKKKLTLSCILCFQGGRRENVEVDLGKAQADAAVSYFNTIILLYKYKTKIKMFA